MSHPTFAAALLIGAVLGTTLAAQETGQTGAGYRGITVFGTGVAKARPDVVEIGMRAAATAELTADAIVKYRDAMRRTRSAFEKLKLKDLAIEELGVSMSNGNSADAMQAMMRGMPPDTSKIQVQIASSLSLRLSGVREMTTDQIMETVGRLLDTARDSGATIGPSAEDLNMAWRYGRQTDNALVRFVVSDLDSLREAAYEKAVADARARARRLAKLNGLKLNGVTNVQEVQVSGEDGSAFVQPGQIGYPDMANPNKSKISSETFTEVPFRVKLQVQFAVLPDGDETASQ